MYVLQVGNPLQEITTLDGQLSHFDVVRSSAEKVFYARKRIDSKPSIESYKEDV